MTWAAGPWERQGLLVRVQAEQGWTSHAQGPTVLELAPRLWRIYFAGRDASNRATVRAVDVDPGDGMRVVARHLSPLLSPGEVGCFDSMGLGPSCALRIDGRVHLYYTGVYVRQDVRFQLSVGLAIGDDGLTFRRASAGPVWAAGLDDPYFVSTPCIRPDAGGYRMWYVSGTGWIYGAGGVEPTYALRTCWSPDGLTWGPRSRLALQPTGTATALGRPWVTAEADGLRLWFCQRGDDFRHAGSEAYRIASLPLDSTGAAKGTPIPVAFSPPPHPGEFDDWMQAYCCVMPWQGGHVMFYNGNGFGEAGFGWAIRRG